MQNIQFIHDFEESSVAYLGKAVHNKVEYFLKSSSVEIICLRLMGDSAAAILIDQAATLNWLIKMSSNHATTPET